MTDNKKDSEQKWPVLTLSCPDETERQVPRYSPDILMDEEICRYIQDLRANKAGIPERHNVTPLLRDRYVEKEKEKEPEAEKC